MSPPAVGSSTTPPAALGAGSAIHRASSAYWTSPPLFTRTGLPGAGNRVALHVFTEAGRARVMGGGESAAAAVLGV